MRIPTETEYKTAQRALAIYEEWSAQFRKRNGWTVIPKDAARPLFAGHPLDTDTVNAFSADVELYQLAHDKPAEFLAYVTERGITTWTGEVIGKVTTAYPWRRCGTPTGGTYKRRNLRIRTDWGYNYIATETDNKQIVRLRRVAD